MTCTSLDLISPDKGNTIQDQCGREVYAPRYILGILNGRTMNFATHTRPSLFPSHETVGLTRCRDETLAQPRNMLVLLFGYSSGHSLC